MSIIQKRTIQIWGRQQANTEVGILLCMWWMMVQCSFFNCFIIRVWIFIPCIKWSPFPSWRLRIRFAAQSEKYLDCDIFKHFLLVVRWDILLLLVANSIIIVPLLELIFDDFLSCNFYHPPYVFSSQHFVRATLKNYNFIHFFVFAMFVILCIIK